MPDSSNRPRYTLRYPLGSDPNYAVRFDSLQECAEHVKGRADAAPVRIYDGSTQKHGRLFPSGRVRWNG